ncbi:hypothetical protein [Ferrimonas kyonanensis]|uniref:hypothetical protein n=1 Tax=Ferrimonas kyonanensis TaxID=364763 RepID=UPI000485F3CA|nr:hypothetical protein [Ferrimonas kyonanensis]
MKIIRSMAVTTGAWIYSNSVAAGIQLPGFAESQDAKEQTEKVAEKAVDYMFYAIGVMIIVGLLITAFHAISGDSDKAAKWGKGVFVGGIISMSAYGIANWFV